MELLEQSKIDKVFQTIKTKLSKFSAVRVTKDKKGIYVKKGKDVIKYLPTPQILMDTWGHANVLQVISMIITVFLRTVEDDQMKSKDVLLKTGKTVTLWFNEGTGQYVLDKKLASSNFQKYILGEHTCDNCTNKQKMSIREYYNNSSNINKDKIKTMINEDIKKVELVYNIILESIINKKRKR